MKKKKLEKEIRKLGWILERQGGNHEVWSNGKGVKNFIPRHPEINENLAKSIIRFAKSNPGSW